MHQLIQEDKLTNVQVEKIGQSFHKHIHKLIVVATKTQNLVLHVFSMSFKAFRSDREKPNYPFQNFYNEFLGVFVYNATLVTLGIMEAQ